MVEFTSPFRNFDLMGEPDKVSELYAAKVARYAKHRRWLTRSPEGSYRAVVSVARLGDVHLTRNAISHETVFAPQERAGHVVVSVMKRGSTWTRTARRGGVEGTYGGPLFHIVQAEAGFQSRVSDDSALEATIVPAAMLKSRFEAIVGETVGELRFDPTLDMRAGPGASIHRAIELLRQDLADPLGLLHSPVVGARYLDYLLTALVVGGRHDWSHLLDRRGSQAGPRSVKRAEDYMRAHAHEPITLADLASAAGCSGRALQLAFRQWRGAKPMQVLQRVRLERAREELLRGEAESVTAVAMRCGFGHLGRFAAEYRTAFGESPRETLASHGYHASP